MRSKFGFAIIVAVVLSWVICSDSAQAQKVNGMTFSPAPVAGGQVVTVSLSLSSPAPVGGVVIMLSSDSAAAPVAKSVPASKGATSVSFKVTTTKVTSIVYAHISATTTTSDTTWTWTAALEVDPVGYMVPRVDGMGFSANPVAGGSVDTVRLALTAFAPPGGLVVALRSSSAAVVIPAEVTVPAGAASVSFSAAIKTVSSLTNVQVTAATNYQGSYYWYNFLQVLPVGYVIPKVVSMGFLPNPAVAGGNCTVTLGLNTAAPAGGLGIKIGSSTSAVTVPASVIAAAGSKSVVFTIRCSASITSATDVVISATTSVDGTWTWKGPLVVDPAGYAAPKVDGLTFTPAPVVGGKNDIVTVFLTTAAPAGGLQVTLAASSDVLKPPAAVVTVPAGDKGLNITFTTAAVSADTKVTVSATTHVSGTWIWSNSVTVLP